ncbi:hypothetical protein NDU88_005630 [Pleurodeles waltl]|uniref:Uncharacterized protein n=1 Tax=Pleurodeles waltl TaxID=8319 RepID=A0AAV7MZ00_PLEWA|nr:hypothetical protein NDU88_005630 [Pleurodeles waltl]
MNTRVPRRECDQCPQRLAQESGRCAATVITCFSLPLREHVLPGADNAPPTRAARARALQPPGRCPTSSNAAEEGSRWPATTKAPAPSSHQQENTLPRASATGAPGTRATQVRAPTTPGKAPVPELPN